MCTDISKCHHVGRDRCPESFPIYVRDSIEDRAVVRDVVLSPAPHAIA
jgi:hypothetical protein